MAVVVLETQAQVEERGRREDKTDLEEGLGIVRRKVLPDDMVPEPLARTATPPGSGVEPEGPDGVDDDERPEGGDRASADVSSEKGVCRGRRTRRNMRVLPRAGSAVPTQVRRLSGDGAAEAHGESRPP